MTASRQAHGGAGSGQPRIEPNPGLEPLLWLQLLGIGAIAGEMLAVLVLLGSVDPGALPGLERLLIWALGALGPAVLLWKRPADPWSLLLLQAPLRGRRDIQRRLMRLQDLPALRLMPLLAATLLLPAIWRIDQASGLAAGLSPLASSSRLMVLLLSVPLLAVIVWQWQQIWQAVWLLSRPASAISAAEPLSITEQEQQRLSLGLPLLLLDPLQDSRPVVSRQQNPATAEELQHPQEELAAAVPVTAEPSASPPSVSASGAPEPMHPEPEAGTGDEAPRSGPGAIEPEQAAADPESGELNQEITGLDS